ncbi:unnamed protein product [Gongylonema pulchrum]|uniref:PH domain-containing protein n=1 Tax=Gongylonema pulchrum TaxID=637853 RepID=A0A183E446_9BILA|nr:unnamed protein product [Gongylonema pulchrum]
MKLNSVMSVLESRGQLLQFRNLIQIDPFISKRRPMAESRKLKEGEILRYKSGFLGKKWKECWAVLFSDSELVWFDKKSDSKPAGSLFLKDYVPYTCVGPMCDRMPVRRPELPERYSVYHLVGIGTDPQASKVYWFLFSSDSDLESWFTEIMKTLPKPNPPPAGAQQPRQADVAGAPPSTYNPPPVYPSGPPPVASTYPNQPTYAAQSNPMQPYPPQYAGPVYGASGPGYGSGAGAGGGTTVIIADRGGGDYGQRYGGGGYSGSSGPGIGTGLLMGSLMGFGLGSMWGGGLHSGLGFGYPSCGGMGGGFGGGYVQDNDTYITNNYYGGGPDGAGSISTGDTTPAITDVTDTAGGHMIEDQHDGYDVGGGGDFGGYDVGGGGDDFGGGMDDFGGGGDDFGGGGDWFFLFPNAMLLENAAAVARMVKISGFTF